jgi:microcin C transport system permease protein
MTGYFARRLLLIIPTFLGVTMIAFTITRMVPGGPLEREIRLIRTGGGGGGEAGGSGAGLTGGGTNLISDEALKQLKANFDLDKPAPVAYVLWLKKVLTLDLGKSYSKRLPVRGMIAARIPISMTFGLTGFVLAYLIAIPLGIRKALTHGSLFDLTTSGIVFVGYSIPGWAIGTLLLVFLASGRFFDVMPLGGVEADRYENLPWLARQIDSDPAEVCDEFGMLEWERLSPVSKLVDRAWHMALPVFCYMIASFATLTILAKNSLMENLGQDYVRTAFAKGLSPRRVILLHTLRNSLIPLATGLGGALGVLMASSYLIEWVFNIDGMGFLGYTSIVNRDYTVVMGILAVNTLLVLLGNILSDVLYALIDPRIRFECEAEEPGYSHCWRAQRAKASVRRKPDDWGYMRNLRFKHLRSFFFRNHNQ